jgi:3-phenylpropionate/trans-cinnamate dioxygenase ferredoxin reductase subunit
VLVGDEPGLPYSRPPLSKAFLLGEAEEADLAIRPGSVYADHRIDLVTGKVVGIDRAERLVRLEDQRVLPYDALVLATGGRPRRLTAQGLDGAANVHSLKTLQDAIALKQRLRTSSRIAIMGGGYIGLETAAAACQLGLKVTVLEAQPRLLARVTSQPVSDFYRRLHASHGADIRLFARTSAFEYGSDGLVTAVILSGGERIACDLLLVGIGQVPNTQLAAQAGLAVDEGIVVDEACRTSDPRILAVGDCTRQPCGEGQAPRRIESVDNALQQAQTAAAVLAGSLVPARSAPWFWSNQFDARLQSVGIYEPTFDSVVRGDPEAGGSFSVFYLDNGSVVAADVVSSPRDFAAARKLASSRAKVSGAMLADVAVSLHSLASGVTGACAVPRASSSTSLQVSA